MSLTFDENIDPALRAIDSPIISPQPTTSPAILPNGSLVSKPDFKALRTLVPFLLSAFVHRRLCCHNSDAFTDRRSNIKTH